MYFSIDTYSISVTGLLSLVAAVPDNDHSSDDGPREGLSESDGEQQNPIATTYERYFHGLLKGKKFSRKNVSFSIMPGRGRSAFATRQFYAGDFVCEYASCVKKRSESVNDDSRYQDLNLGCYALDAHYDGEHYTFDATGTINDPGRYINHACRNTNLLLMKPVMIGGRLRIGFVAKRHIAKGEELFYDYGIRDRDIPWLKSDGRVLAEPIAIKEISRQRLKCPVTPCPSRQHKDGLLKLSQHLLQYHHINNKSQREKLCADARKVNVHIGSYS